MKTEVRINRNYWSALASSVKWVLLIGTTTELAFAQSSSFSQAAQGIAQEMIAIAKWVGIILCIICGSA
jgi:hypothetical protein